MNVNALSTQTDALIHASVCSLPSKLSRSTYTRRLRAFLDWLHKYSVPFDHLYVNRYLSDLHDSGASAGTLNQILAAVKKLAETSAATGAITSDVALQIREIRAMKSSGARTGNWLTVEQARQLLGDDDGTIKGRRDRTVIALLLGCGLRRAEAAQLRTNQFQVRDSRTLIVDLIGKGKKIRTVPIPAWAMEIVRVWVVETSLTARAKDGNYAVLRSINEDGSINGSLSASGIWRIVVERARAVGIQRLAPHDLRRTFAKLCRKGGAEIDQIQIALGHSSVKTTERYLNTALDLEHPACDKLGI